MKEGLKEKVRESWRTILVGVFYVATLTAFLPHAYRLTSSLPKHVHCYLWFVAAFANAYLGLTLAYIAVWASMVLSASRSWRNQGMKSPHQMMVNALLLFSCLFGSGVFTIGFLHHDVVWGMLVLSTLMLIEIPLRCFGEYVLLRLSGAREGQLSFRNTKALYLWYAGYIWAIAAISLVVLMIYSVFYYVRWGLFALLILPWGIRYVLMKMVLRCKAEQEREGGTEPASIPPR